MKSAFARSKQKKQRTAPRRFDGWTRLRRRSGSVTPKRSQPMTLKTKPLKSKTLKPQPWNHSHREARLVAARFGCAFCRFGQRA